MMTMTRTGSCGKWIDLAQRAEGFRAWLKLFPNTGGALLVLSVQSRMFRGFLERDTMSEEHIEVEGCIQTVLPGTMFRVELDNKHVVLATISGKMRKRWVRLTAGDRVKMEMSPYDLDKARIVWRR